jgi:putative hydrolase of the HAD superfamily
MFKDLKPKAVLLDLYGTLIDIWTDEQRPEVWDKLARFLRYRGLQADARTIKGTFFSLAQTFYAASNEKYAEVDVASIFRTILSDLGYDGPAPFLTEVAQLFRTLSMLRFDLFPDTLSTLRALRGAFKLGLVSDAQRAFFDPEMKMTGLDLLLEVIVVSSDHGFRKPDRRLFDLALSELGTSPEQTIYVGDNIDRDIHGAKSAGLQAILIDRDGLQDGANCIYKPDQIFRGLDELRRWLLD